MRTVATTSTLSSAIYIGLQGVGCDASEHAVFELVSACDVSSAIKLVEEGSVLDEAAYELSLHLDVPLRPERILVSVCGGEPEGFVVARESLLASDGNRVAYTLRREDEARDGSRDAAVHLFRMAYGFARIEVELEIEGVDESFLLSTLDIPCRSQNANESAHIERMLMQLLDTNDEAASWMFSCSRDASTGYSLLDGADSTGSASSLGSMMGLIERVLAEYEKQAGFFRNGACSRIVRQSRTVPVGAVRTAGRDELMWMARNTGSLYECAERQGVQYHGSWYMPRKLETTVRAKSFDCYENQRVLGFLSEIIRTATGLLNALKDGSQGMLDIEERLGRLGEGSSMLPALAIIRLYTARGRRHVARLEACVAHARELRRMYGSFLPDVREAFGYSVRRTKVFTEIRPYYRLFAFMQEWLAFGEFAPARESLAFQAAKLDRLYEYFVLYRMTSWLAGHGFSPQAGNDHAIRLGIYEPEGFFKPETGVATVYELESDVDGLGAVGVTLYYQPIIRSNDKEAEGICLHRLSCKAGRRAQNYWTPDFLLAVTMPDGSRTYHVVDAKYRFAHDLAGAYPKSGALAECVMKYKQDVMGAAGEHVESVWLVAGKWKYDTVVYAETSPWARAHAAMPRSGVAVLTTDVDKLDAVFAEVLGDAYALVVPDRADGASAGDGGSAPVLEEICLISAASAQDDTEVAEAGAAAVASDADDEVVGIREEAEAGAADAGAAAEGGGGHSESLVQDEADGELPSAKLRRQKKRRAEKDAAPRSSRPAKKANLPKPKPARKCKKITPFSLDGATLAAIETVIKRLGDADLLYNPRWAQRELGLERPLLRRRAPTGREAGFYDCENWNGEARWLVNRWSPVQKNKLQGYVRQLERTWQDDQSEQA